MSKSNGRSNGNKGVKHIKIPVCNALTVANKCRDPLPIKVRMIIKLKREHNSYPKNHYPIEFFYDTLQVNSFLT